MDTSNYYTICYIVVGSLIIAIAFAILCVNVIVWIKSPIIQELKSINKKISFYNDIRPLSYTTYTNTKQQFNVFNFDKYFQTVISENKEYFTSQINKVENNISKYSYYITTTNGMWGNYNSEKKKGPFKKIYSTIEYNLFRSAIIKPIMGFTVKCTAYYTSPKGRNSYSKYVTFTYVGIKQNYNIVNQTATGMTRVKRERSLMTDSLRYDIMKRDGFRCQLCGKSASDGVKLHVDHIVPISKGGRTVSSNLRTLCEQCNLGKRDKYDPRGIN